MTILRFDYPKSRGWVVRARAGRFSKLFSDSKFGGNVGARTAAEKFGADYLEHHPEELAPAHDIDRQPRANNKSGVPGVSFVTCSPRSLTGHAWTFWQASCPGGPAGDVPTWGKRFTCSIHGFDRARELAEEFRAAWVEARDAGKLSEFWKERGLVGGA